MQFDQNYGPSSKGPVKTMQLIHLALLAGQVMFGIVTLFITPASKFEYTNTNDVHIFIVPVFAIAMVAISRFLFSKLLAGAASADNLSSKLVSYQSALIVQLALIEGASLFGIVVYTISSNLLYLFISALLVVYFFFQRPTVQKITNDLNLSPEEAMEMK